MGTKKKSGASVKRYPVEQFFSIRSITGFTLSPDGKKVYYITNTTGLPQIWSVPIDGGWADQISLWHDSIKGVVHYPKDKKLIFMGDENGNEQTQIYSMPDTGGEVVYESKGFEDSQTSIICFNKKGDKYLFCSNKKLQYNFETYIKDNGTGKNKLVYSFEDKYPTVPESWSDNEKYIAFARFYGNINQDILLYDTGTKKLKNITEHDPVENIFNSNIEFAKDSKGFYFISDEGREFKGIKFYDIKKDKAEWFIKEKWDVTDYKFSKDYNYLGYTVNKYGSNVPKLMNMKTGKVINLKLPKGNYSSLKFTSDNKSLAFICDNPLNPADIYIYNLKTHKNKQITFSLVGGIDKNAYTKPKDIFYESFDGLKIHGLLYIPKGLKKDGSNPAIVWPHGGPEWQEMHNFSKYLQVLSNAGFIVIAPNFRGSVGYGKTFQQKIYKDWGGAEFKDVLASVDYLKDTGYVDSKKIAIVGGSFGGFMCLTCITKAPELWKCAIDVFGPSNMFTFLSSIPEHWKEATSRLIGDVEIDKELLHERSPINYVDNIKCPLLVIQGRHDPRVVVEESEQIVNKLKQQNKPVEYMLLEDEGHGFTRVKNTIDVFKKNIEFLEKHLR
jgi:dipeptidyl aminopeptidase/acylaminoacyl peptidase